MVSHECLRDGFTLKKVEVVVGREEYFNLTNLTLPEKYIGHECPYCGELTFWKERIPDSDAEVEAFLKEVRSRKEQIKLKVEAVPVGQ